MSAIIEKWKPVPFALEYEASDQGRVRRIGKEEALKPWTHKSGHLYIKLGRRKRRAQVHRLILEVFVSSCPFGMECRHLNGVASDNRLSNLKWGTRSENISDYRNHNGQHFRAKLSLETAALIRSLFSGKHGDQSRLARQFNVSLSIINRIVLRRTYA